MSIEKLLKIALLIRWAGHSSKTNFGLGGPFGSNEVSISPRICSTTESLLKTEPLLSTVFTRVQVALDQWSLSFISRTKSENTLITSRSRLKDAPSHRHTALLLTRVLQKFKFFKFVFLRKVWVIWIAKDVYYIALKVLEYVNTKIISKLAAKITHLSMISLPQQ